MIKKELNPTLEEQRRYIRRSPMYNRTYVGGEKKPPRFKSAFNANKFPRSLEKAFGESETVPGQAMTVKDILTRFTGMTYPQSRKMEFHGEQEVMSSEEFRRLDLAEQEDIIEQARQKTHEELRKLRRKAEDASIEKQKAIFRKEFEAELQKLKDDTVGKPTTASSGSKDQDL